MYIPKPFQVDDTEQILNFMRQYSFGTLFSQKDGVPFASHLPFLIQQDETEGEYYLYGHMAKSNPHWRHTDDQVLVAFQGPHAYISPTWYGEANAVPTWNYAAVHAYGKFIMIDQKEQVASLIQQTVDHYESSMEVPWTTDLSGEFI